MKIIKLEYIPNLKKLSGVQINSRIIRDGETEPRFAHGIVRDISEAKEQQEAFEAQKKQLDAIVDNSSLGIVLTKKGRVVKSNKAFQDLIEYSEEELVGMTVRDVSMGDDEELSYMYLNKLKTGEVDEFRINKRYEAKSGKIIWAKTSVAAVRNEDRSIKYEVAVIEDITEELKQEALLEALNNLMASILGKTNIYEIAWEITKKYHWITGI